MAAPPAWQPDAFSTRFERRDDGTLFLYPEGEIAAYPARLTDWLEHWAQAAPQRVFVARRDATGRWLSVTYAQMHERVVRIASGLATRDLSGERPIAILSGNSIEHLTLALAAMWVGIPYCPVSTAYSQPTSDLRRLRDSLDLLTPGLVAAFGMPAVAQLADGTVTSLDVLDAEPSQIAADRHASTNADTIAKFLLTSGSTGQPKAVITPHRMLCSNAAMLRQAMPFLVDEPPVLVDWLPWSHTFGGSHNVGLVLSCGGSLYIDDGKPTPAGIAATVRNLREIAPTVYFNVPKGFEMLARQLREDAALRGSFYRQLRAYFFAGASLAQHTWDALDEVSLQERGHRTPMLSGLGATETGPSVTFTTPAMGRSGVIGLPAAGNIVKLAPLQEKIEIRVRGPSVTPGYWRQPELTARAFDDQGFYKLGDAVRLIDAQNPTRGLRFDGRIGEDFKLANGTWVSVGPLRADLIHALAPAAQDVVIAGLDADFVAALILPDCAACQTLLELAAAPSQAELARDPRLIAWLKQRLVEHATQNPASTRCVRRALVLPTPPSLDHGEITDKGSINQRAVLRQRADCLAALYSLEPPCEVADIGDLAPAH